MYDEQHLYENVYYQKVPPKPVQPHNPELLQKTKQQADEIVEILYENVNRVMERQEKLEDLNVTADNLDKQASVFKKRSAEVKRKHRWAHMKTKIVIAIVILVFLIMIIASIISAMIGGDAN